MLYILWESEKGLAYMLHEYFTNHMGVRKGLYWGFQIEHRNKKNLKNTITLYTLISPPPERNDQPVIDLCTIDSRLTV